MLSQTRRGETDFARGFAEFLGGPWLPHFPAHRMGTFGQNFILDDLRVGQKGFAVENRRTRHVLSAEAHEPLYIRSMLQDLGKHGEALSRVRDPAAGCGETLIFEPILSLDGAT